MVQDFANQPHEQQGEEDKQKARRKTKKENALSFDALTSLAEHMPRVFPLDSDRALHCTHVICIRCKPARAGMASRLVEIR